jgi:HAD superfamily hydrolase (TIGR01484 family)
MRPLEALGEAEAQMLEAVVFDLDDTLLEDGELGLEAYGALFVLRAAGLALVASTGRPAAWAELAVRWWPIDMALGENGAVAYQKLDARSVVRLGERPDDEARERAELERIASELERRHPELRRADDNALRLTDIAFDIGERHHLAPELVEGVRLEAAELGAHTTASSIHMHVTLSRLDKATGFERACELRGLDPARSLARAAYVGDSLNDEAAFAAFGLSFGVANVARFVERLRVPPSYVASLPAGHGFAEIATRILALRGSTT